MDGARAAARAGEPRGARLPVAAAGVRARRLPGRRGDGPLAFAERLATGGAPGAGSASRVVELYVRARFAGRPLDEGGRRELAGHAAEAREALRRSRGPRPRRLTPV